MIAIDDFLAAEDARRWEWGKVDCLMRCADWALALTGRDPAADWRGSYATPIGAWRIVAAAGGMVEHVGRHLEPQGWRRTDEPDTGDIGVVLAPSGVDGVMKGIGALRYGPWWSVRGERDVIFAGFETVAAWTWSGR